MSFSLKKMKAIGCSFILLFANAFALRYRISTKNPDVFPLSEFIQERHHYHNNVLKELNDACIQVLKQEIRFLVNDVINTQSEFSVANRTCQAFLQRHKNDCWTCAELKCLNRFQVLRCTNQLALRDGMIKLTILVNYYFNNVIPSFFTEDLKVYFGVQSNIYFYFYMLFYDRLLHSVPQAVKSSDFAQIFKHEIPTLFLEEDIPNILQSGFSEYFKSLTSAINDLKLKHPDQNVFQLIQTYLNTENERQRRSLKSEPLTCNDLESTPVEACSYYVETCPSCFPTRYDREVDCPSLADAHQKAKEIFWFPMASLSNGTMFRIHSITNGNVGFPNGVFNNAQVYLTIFGKDLTLQFSEPLFIRNTQRTAETIVDEAIEQVKKKLIDFNQSK